MATIGTALVYLNFSYDPIPTIIGVLSNSSVIAVTITISYYIYYTTIENANVIVLSSALNKIAPGLSNKIQLPFIS